IVSSRFRVRHGQKCCAPSRSEGIDLSLAAGQVPNHCERVRGLCQGQITGQVMASPKCPKTRTNFVVDRGASARWAAIALLLMLLGGWVNGLQLMIVDSLLWRTAYEPLAIIWVDPMAAYQQFRRLR